MTWTVHPDDEKIRSVRAAVPWLGMGLHIGQFLFSPLLGIPFALGALSIGSVALFAGCVVLVRRGWSGVAMVIAFLEIWVHASLLTVYLGVGTMYWLYFFQLAVGLFLVARWDDRTRVLPGVVLAAVTGVAMPFWPVAPIVDLPPETVRMLGAMNLAATGAVLPLVVAWFARASALAAAETERERQRAEALLRNVLPDEIVARLKDRSGRVADHCGDATVLFADIVGFTPLASKLESGRLLEVLDDLFTAFDQLADEHGLEKIKTIGDAYMAAAGVPRPHGDAAGAMARMGLGMLEVVRAYAERTGLPLDLRIGIHSGPLVAGVIGQRKFAYDLWGDTVNTASRLESHGLAGRVHLSEPVRNALADRFLLEARGPIELKGKGTLNTWFLLGPAAR